MKKQAIITAGGYGLRMGGDLPKQFLMLAGMPLVMHTIRKFYEADASICIYLTLPEAFVEFWDRLCIRHHFILEHTMVTGGETRFHSVQKALMNLPSEGFVAIHDGVRPLTTTGLIHRMYEEAATYGAAIPVLRLHETLRMVTGKSSTTADRNAYRTVQTPQVFLTEKLIRAYDQPYNPSFTDDASVYETLFSDIHLSEGEPYNIKITTPADLKIAETLWHEN